MPPSASTRRVVPAGDGVDIVTESRGEGRPPLLLLHGFTGSRIDWDDVVDGVAGGRTVVTMDHRGFGESTNTGAMADYTFDHLVADVVAVIDRLGLAPVQLLGHSMGGVIAMRVALEHPGLLASLVLMDTGAASSGGIPLEFIDPLADVGRTQGMAAAAAIAAQAIADAGVSGATPAARQRLETKWTQMDPEAFAAFARELNTYPSLLDGLATLELPVTILVGENDGLMTASAAMHAAIPGSELVVFANAGHSPQEDVPGEWIAAVGAHLSRAGTR